VKLRAVLSDTGRPIGSAVNLLNAGWTATTAVPLPGGGWTVPQQALTVFVEAPWDQLNRLQTLVIELVDDEGTPVHFAPGPASGGPPVHIQHQVVVPPVQGAPNGTPGAATVFIDLPQGALWLTPRHRYIWRISTEGVTEEIGFWVQAPPQLPVIGAGVTPPPIPPGPTI
jgi:hypothetical protein